MSPSVISKLWTAAHNKQRFFFFFFFFFFFTFRNSPIEYNTKTVNAITFSINGIIFIVNTHIFIYDIGLAVHTVLLVRLCCIILACLWHFARSRTLCFLSLSPNSFCFLRNVPAGIKIMLRYNVPYGSNNKYLPLLKQFNNLCSM
jgi:hypothetical protein